MPVVVPKDIADCMPELSRVEVMMTLVHTAMLQCFTESRYCSNFLSGTAKCSNSRPAKNLGRTSGITLEIQEFTCVHLACMSFSWYRNREEEFTCHFQRLIPLYLAQIFLD